MANVLNSLALARSFTVYPSQTATVSPDTQEYDGLNENMSGLAVVVNVTAASGTSPTLTVNVLGVDRLSGQTWTLGASAMPAITAAGLYVIKIHPNLPAASTFTSNACTRQDILPEVIRFQPVIGGTTPSFTFSVTGHFTD